jgi:hypothetical protein
MRGTREERWREWALASMSIHSGDRCRRTYGSVESSESRRGGEGRDALELDDGPVFEAVQRVGEHLQ